MSMVKSGLIKPVQYAEEYKGIESIPRALEDLHQRKVWGRSVVEISGAPEDSAQPKL